MAAKHVPNVISQLSRSTDDFSAGSASPSPLPWERNSYQLRNYVILASPPCEDMAREVSTIIDMGMAWSCVCAQGC
jgi:hypothetical protein